MAWNSELNVFRVKKDVFAEIFNRLHNCLFETNVYKTLELC